MTKSDISSGDIDVYRTKYLIQNLMQQWELTFTKCDKLILHLDDKEILENVRGFTSVAGQVYIHFNNLMCHIVNRHRAVLGDARSRWEEIEVEAMLCEKKSTETQAEVITKCAEVSQVVKIGWDAMMACVVAICAAYSNDPRTIYGGPLSLKQLEAYEFCSNAIEDVRSDCAMR